MVDGPAWLAASLALAGERDCAVSYVVMFLADFREKITFGREPEPGEPLRWLFHVNPLRRSEDADHLVRGLRLAGLADDPDHERRAVASAPPPLAASPTTPAAEVRASFRREGGLRWQGRKVR